MRKSVWESNEVRFRHGCGIWKSIQRVHNVFWKHIQFKLGSGREIRFWEGRRMEEVPFRKSFRCLYSLAIDPKGSVVDLYDLLGNSWA